jgi:hypothetical protein
MTPGGGYEAAPVSGAGNGHAASEEPPPSVTPDPGAGSA